jgi:hypothetical protein
MLAVELDIMETDLKFSVDSYWRDEVSWLFPPCVMHTHTYYTLLARADGVSIRYRSFLLRKQATLELVVGRLCYISMA